MQTARIMAPANGLWRAAGFQIKPMASFVGNPPMALKTMPGVEMGRNICRQTAAGRSHALPFSGLGSGAPNEQQAEDDRYGDEYGFDDL